MGIVERDGKVYARKIYRDSAGKKKQIWRLAKNRTDAKNILRDIENKLDVGIESFANRDTLDDYLDKWLDTAKGTVSDRTWEDYRGLLRLYFRPVLGKKRLSAIKPIDIQSIITSMSKRGLAPKTIQYAHMVLRRALKEAVMPYQLITSNPARDIKLPKRVRREMKCLSPEEAGAFLAECAKDKHGLLFEFALVTGMRPEEYLGLRWSDVDLAGNRVSVQQVLVRNRKGGGWSFCPPKTPKSRRTIPIPVYLKTQLAEAKMRQNEARLKAGGGWQVHNLVFCSDAGTPLCLKNIECRHFKPVLKRVYLPNIRLYDLRHTCATLLLAAGVNPKVVAERLGHASIVQTLDTYSHVLPTMQEAATEELERILKKG